MIRISDILGYQPSTVNRVLNALFDPELDFYLEDALCSFDDDYEDCEGVLNERKETFTATPRY